MAAHWVAELFPPKFSYETVADIQEKHVDFEPPKLSNIDVSEYYARVFRELEICEESVDGKIGLGIESGNLSRGLIEEKCSENETQIEQRHESHVEEKSEECIWSDKELRTLRKFVQKVKLQNLYLVAMVESLQEQLRKTKDNKRAATDSLEVLQSKWCELKKRYKRVKISCKAMKGDLKEYHTKLKIAYGDIKELKQQMSEWTEERKQIKSELNREKLTCEDLKGQLARAREEHESALQHHEFMLTEQYQLEKNSWIREIGLLKEQLWKEKDEHSLSKRALEHLRTHFANQHASNTDAFDSKCPNVISIVDIDYL
ncbi:predicted protein [Nematostella vectensis]|uniref:Uncharacterized protein n=1 Tax=Nematostella vectensis TaxID=45351 RepID=A7SIW8_NEMVE|nr:coiled-coil domain-containing protein 160 homolog [Nematostella vectensis]EDO36376.1 predicted protein [Nematostella vectensis]|eukprot:XP_001628439.1 predicted protein [Nematostella vectensis]